jgi:hypothetical protein
MHRSVFCLYLGHLSTDLRAVFTNRYSALHTIMTVILTVSIRPRNFCCALRINSDSGTCCTSPVVGTFTVFISGRKFTLFWYKDYCDVGGPNLYLRMKFGRNRLINKNFTARDMSKNVIFLTFFRIAPLSYPFSRYFDFPYVERHKH